MPVALVGALTAITGIAVRAAQVGRPASRSSGMRLTGPALIQAIVMLEDSRAPRPEDLALLEQALRDPASDVQQIAVRAAGRLERASFLSGIQPLLSAPSPAVRREAANALGQALMSGSDAGSHVPDVVHALLARLNLDEDAAVRGVLLETLGRLPYQTATEVAQVEAVLSAGLQPRLVDDPAAEGAAKGLGDLIRLRSKIREPSTETIASLRLAARTDEMGGTRRRRLAMAALLAANALDADTIETAQRDADVEVRRLAAAGAGRVETLDRRDALLRAGMRDQSPMVRFEALSGYGSRRQAEDCERVRAAAADHDPHVALRALDLLGDPCPDPEASIEVLERTTHEPGTSWHRSAHAFAALARRSRERANPLLGRFAAHPIWQVRMYAARAAASLGAAARLEALAADENDNVREAAVDGLRQTRRHDADDVYLSELARPDYQLIRTAARALEGTPRAQDAAKALLAALERLTRERRDTSRDPRMAILERLREVGGAVNALTLMPFVRDFDPVVAAESASILTAWTGRPVTAMSVSARRPPTSAALELGRLASLRARVTMAGGRAFDLRLFPSDAPLTSGRFVRLARAGYYRQLTFHRVVPNFVIQGGSPGANEYMGDASYMRDEVGLRSHLRGTVGISTRGRDTGDAQIFINLADNPRLDHIYTVFAEVTDGMPVVDRILEGDVIEQVDILEK